MGRAGLTPGGIGVNCRGSVEQPSGPAEPRHLWTVLCKEREALPPGMVKALLCRGEGRSRQPPAV